MIRVFLADDHTVVREGLRFLLEAQGDITVVGDAADGRAAVREVRELCPDVVVMDIAMPALNGIEATQLITKSCGETRVIMLSMYAGAEHIYRAFEAGADGYVLKDSAGSELVDAVRAVHTGNRFVSPKIADTMAVDYLGREQESFSGSPLERLSLREREVLQLVVEGKSSAQIAEILFISIKTVETYRSRLMQKLGISDVPSLVKFAIVHGLTPLK